MILIFVSLAVTPLTIRKTLQKPKTSGPILFQVAETCNGPSTTNTQCCVSNGNGTETCASAPIITAGPVGPGYTPPTYRNQPIPTQSANILRNSGINIPQAPAASQAPGSPAGSQACDAGRTLVGNTLCCSTPSDCVAARLVNGQYPTMGAQQPYYIPGVGYVTGTPPAQPTAGNVQPPAAQAPAVQPPATSQPVVQPSQSQTGGTAVNYCPPNSGSTNMRTCYQVNGDCSCYSNENLPTGIPPYTGGAINGTPYPIVTPMKQVWEGSVPKTVPFYSSSDKSSETPMISPTPIPPDTKVAISIQLAGIGSRVSFGENSNPAPSTRSVDIQVYDSSGKQVQTATGQVAYNNASSSFKGTTTITAIPSGNYSIKIRVDNSLWRAVKGLSLTAGETTTLSRTTLIPGDLDQDNRISLLDYNILMSCYGSKTCTKKQQADLNMDGRVNEIDLNILYSQFAAERQGD